MDSTVRHARLRVVNDRVSLGRNVFLPPGEYDGTIENMRIDLPRRAHNWVYKVLIPLSEPCLAEIFSDEPRANRAGVNANVTLSYFARDIVEV